VAEPLYNYLAHWNEIIGVQDMGVARQLYQLQEVDLELESAEQALVQIEGRLGENQAVVTAQEEFVREQRRLEELQRQQHAAEWEVDNLATKLAAVEEQLYSGRIGNPKELANLQHEADGLKSRRGQAEDRTLEVMERVAAVEARVAALGSELGRLEEEWNNEQLRLGAEGERYKELKAGLEQRRQQLISGIDASAVGVYEDIRRRKNRAVASVEQGICRGCGISLSTAQLQQAKGDRLVQCGSCGRILFFA
jgi:predicted  nucleic acid-binding Zn-ribbon protein